MGYIAELLGIQYTTFSLLCVTAFLIVMIIELLTIVSVQDQKINTLSQMVGLLSEKRPVEQDEPERVESGSDHRS